MRCTGGLSPNVRKVQAGRIAKSLHRRLRGVDVSELDALAVR